MSVEMILLIISIVGLGVNVYFKLKPIKRATKQLNSMGIDLLDALISQSKSGIVGSTRNDFKLYMQKSEDYTQKSKNQLSVYDHILRAIFWENEGKHENAIKEYSIVIEMAKDAASMYNKRANLYNKIGKHENALKDYEYALKLNSNLTQAKTNINLLKSKINA